MTEGNCACYWPSWPSNETCGLSYLMHVNFFLYSACYVLIGSEEGLFSLPLSPDDTEPVMEQVTQHAGP